MADEPKKLREVKWAALYALAGGLTLAWSIDRAARGLPVWPGFKDANGAPPSAKVGAMETVAFWLVPAFKYATGEMDPKPATSTAASTTNDGSSSSS